MLKLLYEKLEDNRKRGYTLLEVVIVVAITAILVAFLVVNIMRFAQQAYLTQANDNAEVIYMAMQSAITDLKSQGTFDKVFADSEIGDDKDIHYMPREALAGDGALNIDRATDAFGTILTDSAIDKLITDGDMVYLVMDKMDDLTPPSPFFKDSDLLRELITPYISDTSILDQSVLVELNRNNKTVRAAFYSERTNWLGYNLPATVSSVKDKTDVLVRQRIDLDMKLQGYYGTLSVGPEESVKRLENEYVKIYNDDMLTIEWGEFTPETTGTSLSDAEKWNQKKTKLPGMSYDVKIVNAVDTNKVYYEIDGITPYASSASTYYNYNSPSTTPTSIPVYDLFTRNQVSKAMDRSIEVAGLNAFAYNSLTDTMDAEPATKSYRLSYLPADDTLSTPETAGCFRLVIDSITEAGHDDRSISECYPSIPWNENFKVIVEGKYLGEGFTDSMTISEETANAYVDNKGLYSMSTLATSTNRPTNTFEYFWDYVKNRWFNGDPSDTGNYWWYEVAYSRHLNNIRYIVGDNDPTKYPDAEWFKRGKYQNFLLTSDINWSLQKIGREYASDGVTPVHRVTTANTTDSSNLNDTDASRLRVLVPISTGAATIANTGKDGFAGTFTSEIYDDEIGRVTTVPTRYQTGTTDKYGDTVPVYEPYVISNLKIANDNGTDPQTASTIGRVIPAQSGLDGNNVGLFDAVSVEGEITHIAISGVMAQGYEDVGAVAGRFFGYAEDLTVAAWDTAKPVYLKEASRVGSAWSEPTVTAYSMNPMGSAASVGGFTVNTIAGHSEVGGLFGEIVYPTDSMDFIKVNKPGVITDIANGTVYDNQYASGSESLNGIAVVASGDYAGGISGTVSHNISITKVVNTGDITGDNMVGGIAGYIEADTSTDDVVATLDGYDAQWDSATSKINEEYAVTRLRDLSDIGATDPYRKAEYTNYGTIYAKATTAAASGSGYAGGAVGRVGDRNSVEDTYLINLSNCGLVKSDADYAGGLIGEATKATVLNSSNSSDIYAKGSYAGGIVGLAYKNNTFKGVQSKLPAQVGGTKYSITVNLKASIRDSGLYAGISANESAGGIAGAVGDSSTTVSNTGNTIDRLKYEAADVKYPDLDHSAATPEDSLMSEYDLTEGVTTESRYLLTVTSDLYPALYKDPGLGDYYVTVSNTEQVTVYKTSTAVSESAYAGGIVGATYDDTSVNAASSTEPLVTPVTNDAAITAIEGSYAGGIAGYAIDDVSIYNAENGRHNTNGVITVNDTYVQAEKDYAGGIIGAIGSKPASGTPTTYSVTLQNAPLLANPSSSYPEVYTNEAKLVKAGDSYAGGIIGYSSNSSIPIRNVYNGGSVEASTKNAGGIFGTADSYSRLEYEFGVLNNRMTYDSVTGIVDQGILATNDGNIKAGDAAGGIAGSVDSKNVLLNDVFNNGNVQTTKDYAGGIIGYVMVENPGEATGTRIISHSDQVLSDIVDRGGDTSYKPGYTNGGTVKADESYAGGIVGKGSISLVDVYNDGYVTAEDQFAGGLVGETCYLNSTQQEIRIYNTDAMLDRIYNRYQSTSSSDRSYSLLNNNARVGTRKYEGAGGIAGLASGELDGTDAPGIRTESGKKIYISDMYNNGTIIAGYDVDSRWDDVENDGLFSNTANSSIGAASDRSDYAGGIVGLATSMTLEYTEASASALKPSNLVESQSSYALGDTITPNMAPIFARHAAGGLIGGSIGKTSTDDIHVINGINRGTVRAEETSAGGIIGEAVPYALVETGDVVAEKMISTQDGTIPDNDIFSNHATILARDCAGGIIGNAKNVTITNEFNRGEVYAFNDDAGGMVGHIEESRLNNSSVISNTSNVISNMFGGTVTFNNVANVTAKHNNAGGIAGYSKGSVVSSGANKIDADPSDKKVGKVVFEDVYSGDQYTTDASTDVKIEAEENNAGGLAGRFIDTVIDNEDSIQDSLALGIYTNNALVKAKNNAGGVIGNADERQDTTYSYSGSLKDNEVRVDSNHFKIADVYNIGEVEARNFNAGGIFGVVGAGLYENDPELVKLAFDNGMLTNKGNIKAGTYNAGGVFGLVTSKLDTNRFKAAPNANDPDYNPSGQDADVLDVFNMGEIYARYNAGGIAGGAINLDLRYTEATLRDTMSALDPDYRNKFLGVNNNTVKANNNNAGGIIGQSYGCVLQDAFNVGDPDGLAHALDSDTTVRVQTNINSSAGGLVGYNVDGLVIFYSDVITERIKEDRNYVYSNVANVKAADKYAGGIVGASNDKLQIIDAYNNGTVTAGGECAGGLVGYMRQTGNASAHDYVTSISATDPLAGIDTLDNVVVNRTPNSDHGEDGLSIGKFVSYITYTTIVTGTDAQYQLGTDSFGVETYTNRYTNTPKPSTIDASAMNVTALNNAGGIVGNAYTWGWQSRGMTTAEAPIRIEDTFNNGAKDSTGNPICGVWAKQDNAGGIVGKSDYAQVSYSFDVNPGPDDLDTGGGTREDNSKGDHSVMVEAFNDPRVLKDPYAIADTTGAYTGLHMVPNTADVRASSIAPGANQSDYQAATDILSGRQTNLTSQNAGGVIGLMKGGRAERLYSVKGNVVTPLNLGGIVGHSFGYAVVKQASRMGVYNQQKATDLEANNQYDIFTYVSAATGLKTGADLDGVDITASTKVTSSNTMISRGSMRVGGIVGYADEKSNVYDVRNMVCVDGRAYVGGIIGEAGRETQVVLAHNMQPVRGETQDPADDAYKTTLISTSDMIQPYLDCSEVDGCYIGGIVGKGYDTDGTGAGSMSVMMAKNDPLLTQNFEELLTEEFDGNIKKYVRAGNDMTLVSGRRFVGGITGAYGIENYTINTGRIYGVEYIAGISGIGYRITNSFNTADIDATNNYLYKYPGGAVTADPCIFSQAIYVGGIAGQIGHYYTGGPDRVQEVESGSYIKNVFNGGTTVHAASIVGGIVGYSIAPVDVTYNSATLTTSQDATGNDGVQLPETGNFSGGIVGRIEQDSPGTGHHISSGDILVSNSYDSGIIGGKGDYAGLIGGMSGYAGQEVLGSDSERARIVNSYFIKDNQTRFYSSISGQVQTGINPTLRPISLQNVPSFEPYLPQFLSGIHPVIIGGVQEIETDTGVRSYLEMISNQYSTYLGVATASSATGEADLVKHLNDVHKATLSGNDKFDIAIASSSKTRASTYEMSNMRPAKFVYPYSDADFHVGYDYEFPHMDFSSYDGTNAGMAPVEIYLDEDAVQELAGTNQRFTSIDNTQPAQLYNSWPTKLVDYMKVKVEYDSHGSDEDAVYDENGDLTTAGTWKSSPTGGAAVDGFGRKLWQVNYTYNALGYANEYVPTSTWTPETITLTGRFSKQTDGGGNLVLPRIMNFNVYDGHSRGSYTDDDTEFTVKKIESTAQKIYTLVNQAEYTEILTHAIATPTSAIKTVTPVVGGVPQQPCYFYIFNPSGDTTGSAIFDRIEVSLTDDPISGEMVWKIVLPQEEMDSYLAANNGYFTAEATKVYDQSENITQDSYATSERITRMFSMHFSGTNIDQSYNDSVFDEYRDNASEIDLDSFAAGEITTDYPTETAALGSVRLYDTGGGEYAEKTVNRLQIANERHLYNLNKNSNQGDARLSSVLPYITKDSQLIKDVQLTTTGPQNKNCFIIGLTKGTFQRMSGSIDGYYDGRVHTIGNLQVERAYSDGLPSELEGGMSRFGYGLIYDLSGGVVKNLNIGSDSNISANYVGGLCYQVSNGRYTDNVVINPWYENVGPELPKEVGKDAKIYNVKVKANIYGVNAGGFAFRSVHRVEQNSQITSDMGLTADSDITTVTMTDDIFSGSINRNTGSLTAMQTTYVNSSYIAAGFLACMYGQSDDNNLLYYIPSTNYYPQKAFVNGSEVTKDGYVFAKSYSSGIIGMTDAYIAQPQVAVVQKSANNGVVAASERANGISQGTFDGDGTLNGGVKIYYSYSNGIVQTPEDTGLASGIGNIITEARYSANNGSVIGRIASGISNFSNVKTDISTCANNGYVYGKYVAGGIVATPARYTSGRALPYPKGRLELTDCYNTGTVVVGTNIDNDPTDVIYNSFAGGILGYAPNKENVNWYNDMVTKIQDDEKTVLRNCYNTGRVYYKDDGGNFSLNNRNVGGIVGGGLNRYTDIQDCYSLTDAEAGIKTDAAFYRLNTDLTYGGYMGVVTNVTHNLVTSDIPSDDVAYNYNLTAVGDTPYGLNTANMTLNDMLNLDNFDGFVSSPGDVISWIVDHTETDDNGYIYPFPQFEPGTALQGELYVGDLYPTTANSYDAIYNVTFNKQKYGFDVPEIMDKINISTVSNKSAVSSNITYSENTSTTAQLGTFDKIDAASTPSEAHAVPVVTESRYSIHIPGYSSGRNYEIYVYDGDADSTDYEPTMIRRYEIVGGVVYGSGKLHDETSTTTAAGRVGTMQYFNTLKSGGADYASFAGGTLTIGDKEEAGWYMPIHNYYTAVVVERGSTSAVTNNTSFNSRINALATGVKSNAGGIAVAGLGGDVSERFQVHFGGTGANSSIQPHSGTYPIGTAARPFDVRDQYGIIGMTSSGIAQGATDKRYYHQSSDIVITEHSYPMFEFNGVYDGLRGTVPQLTQAGNPVMNDNYTISYKASGGEFGFINYLTPTKETHTDDPSFRATVSNLNIRIQGDGAYSSKMGHYFEAADYVTVIGGVADYMELANIDGVTTLGQIEFTSADPIYNRKNGYVDGKTVPLGGIASLMKDSSIVNSKNNATLGVSISDANATINDIDVSWTEHNSAATARTVIGGVVALAKKVDEESKLNYVFNNGEIRAHKFLSAAGIVYRATDTDISFAANGGYIRGQYGTVAGIAFNDISNGRFDNIYNSGKVEAGAVQGRAVGTAFGLFDTVTDYSRVNNVYNAGFITGNLVGAITKGTNVTALENRAYYLKDEDLYWMDSTKLPDNMTPTSESQLDLLLGFAYIPFESYGFSGDEALVKAGPLSDPYILGDPFALTYDELRAKNFGVDWTVLAAPAGAMLRDYSLDTYPLPQFTAYKHLTRRHIDFPVFFGLGVDVAKTPYETTTEVAGYIPLNYSAGETDETFKDTIKVDLTDLSTTGKYSVLIYDGQPDMTFDSIDGKIDEKTDSILPKLKLTINIRKHYIDTRDFTFDASVPGTTTGAVAADLNKEFSKVITTNGYTYFYEVEALDSSGVERPAVFAKKDFLSDGSVDLVLNNDVLDTLSEPSSSTEPYYTVTVVKTEPASSGEVTDQNKFYSKFSPHFADASAKQNETWDYGTITKPYEIATQRNLYNIGKGVSTTDGYLTYNYIQTQDIEMSDKKAEAPIANAGAGAIGVSQQGTTASPVIPQATVMKAQDQRPELWTSSIGSIAGFSGTYSAADGSGGEYALIDNRSTIQSSIFGKINKTATVSNVEYQLASNATITNSVSGILATENVGTIQNIAFTTKNNSPFSLQLAAANNTFGLVVGSTTQEEVGHVPIVSVVSVSDAITLDRAPQGTSEVILGGVIGKAQGSLQLAGIDSAAKIVYNASGNANSSPVHIGGVIGMTQEVSAIGNTVELNDVNASGNISTNIVGADESLGGIIGTVTGNTVLTAIDSDSTATISSRLMSYGSAESAYGSMIGLVSSNSSVDVSNYNQTAYTGSDRGTISLRTDGSSNINKVSAGGIIGKTMDSIATVSDAAVLVDITTDKLTDDSVGGAIGLVGTGATLSMTGIESQLGIQATNNNRGLYGGLIGEANTATAVDISNVHTYNQDNSYHALSISLATTDSNTETTVGGIIGKTSNSMIAITDTYPGNDIETDGYYAQTIGGMIGHGDHGSISLTDTLAGKDSNITNSGMIELSSIGDGTSYVSGGIAYADEVGTTIDGFRNSGDIGIGSTGSTDAEVYAGGAVGYATGTLSGFTTGDPFTVTNVLNMGSIYDDRDITLTNDSGSISAGIIAMLDGTGASSVNACYNHNYRTTFVQGNRAAGILGDISQDMKMAIPIMGAGTDASTLTLPVELKYNINEGQVDAGYENDGVDDIIRGSEITLATVLPVAQVDEDGLVGNPLNGVYDGESAGLDGMPGVKAELASPSVASPSAATPQITYYNISLKDNVTSSANPMAIPDPDKMSAVALTLGQLQDIDIIRDMSGWNSDILESYDIDPDKPWIIDTTHAQATPGLSSNRLPQYGRSMFGFAPMILSVSETPMSMMVSTLSMELVGGETTSEDEIAVDEDGVLEDGELIDDVSGSTVESEDALATSSDAESSEQISTFALSRSRMMVRSASMTSDESYPSATTSDATSSDAEVQIGTYQAVERQSIVEATGYDVAWKYTDLVEDPDEVEATDSDADEEIPSYEFELIWSVNGEQIFSVATGELSPYNGEDEYSFTITPEMISNMTSELLPGEEKAMQLSIAVIYEGMTLEGLSEDVTVEGTAGNYFGINFDDIDWSSMDISDYSQELQNLIEYTMSRLGDPYSQPLAGYGSYVDCSYLVMDAYRHMGIQLPRTAAAQARYLEQLGLRTTLDSMVPGDLIYYSYTNNGRYKNVSHVAMYVGNGKIVDASSSRGCVVYRDILGLNSIVTIARPMALFTGESLPQVIDDYESEETVIPVIDEQIDVEETMTAEASDEATSEASQPVEDTVEISQDNDTVVEQTEDMAISDSSAITVEDTAETTTQETITSTESSTDTEETEEAITAEAESTEENVETEIEQQDTTSDSENPPVSSQEDISLQS